MSTYKKCGINPSFQREINRGKSFDFGVWNPHKVYLNDDYKQDFVSYENRLYACIKSNQNKLPTNESYWVVCVDTTFETIVSDNSFLVGNGLPEKSASNNSVYLDLDTNTFYRYVNKTWVVIGSIGENNISIEIDTEISDVSENAVANKTVKAYVDGSLENAVSELENYINLCSRYKIIENIKAPDVFLPEGELVRSANKYALYYTPNSETNPLPELYKSWNLSTISRARASSCVIELCEYIDNYESMIISGLCFSIDQDSEKYHIYFFKGLEIIDIQVDFTGNASRVHVGYLLNN